MSRSSESTLTMKPSQILRLHRNAVLDIARARNVANVRVFGSVVHGKDGEGSDIDLLVDAPRGTTLLDMAQLQSEMEQQLGVAVDVLTADDLPASFRHRVLAEAKPL